MPVVKFKFKEKNNIKEFLDKSLKKVKDDDKKDLIMRKMDAINSASPQKYAEVVLIDESKKAVPLHAEKALSHTLSDSDEGEVINTSFGDDLKDKLRNLNKYLATGAPDLPSTRPDKIDLIYRTEDPVTGDVCSGGQYKDGLRVRAKFNVKNQQKVEIKVYFDNKQPVH